MSQFAESNRNGVTCQPRGGRYRCHATPTEGKCLGSGPLSSHPLVHHGRESDILLPNAVNRGGVLHAPTVVRNPAIRNPNLLNLFFRSSLDSQTLVAPLPPEVISGSHFGPTLIGFILHQYHHQHVTQPLLWEQLDQFGIDISAGQLSLILTEKANAFHEEKAQLLPTALEVSPYVQVDDTGARHPGRNGYCTHLGNELFATFESTDSKSRLNFLEILRRPHTDSVINEVATASWERQKLAQALVERLCRGPQEFVDTTAWHARLRELEIPGERHVRIASVGALLGSLIAHGVSPELAILSDGAEQFDVLIHAGCWIHAERPLARMVPYSDKHRAALEKVRHQIGELSRDLKVSRQEPKEADKPVLEAAVRRVVWGTEGFSQDRWDAQGNEGAPDRFAPGVGAARDSLAQQSQRRPCAGLRQEAEDQRQHAERIGTSGAGHVCESEEDVPAVGCELLGVSPGPCAGTGSGPAPGAVDPPEGGGAPGQQGVCRAAPVSRGWCGGPKAGRAAAWMMPAPSCCAHQP